MALVKSDYARTLEAIRQDETQDAFKVVNTMANNLTEQVRGLIDVITAVSKGDLSKKLTIQAKGEVGELVEVVLVDLGQPRQLRRLILVVRERMM